MWRSSGNNNLGSSRKTPLRSQTSSKQVDGPSRPRVSREMLPILDMPIQCHAWVYITCLEILAENCQWNEITFNPTNTKKKKTEQHFYNEDKNKYTSSLRYIMNTWITLIKLTNTISFYKKDWHEHYWKTESCFYDGTLNRTQLHLGESNNKHIQTKQRSNKPQNSPQKRLTKIFN